MTEIIFRQNGNPYNMQSELDSFEQKKDSLLLYCCAPERYRQINCFQLKLVRKKLTRQELKNADMYCSWYCTAQISKQQDTVPERLIYVDIDSSMG